MEACRYKWCIEYGARNPSLEPEKKSWVKTNSSQSRFLAGQKVVPFERTKSLRTLNWRPVNCAELHAWSLSGWGFKALPRHRRGTEQPGSHRKSAYVHGKSLRWSRAPKVSRHYAQSHLFRVGGSQMANGGSAPTTSQGSLLD